MIAVTVRAGCGPKGLLALPAVFLSVKVRSDMGGAGVLELPAAADGRWCKLLRIAVNVMGGLSAGNTSFGRCGAAAHRGGGQRFFDSAGRTGMVLDSVWGLITGNCGWGTCAAQGGLCARADAVNWLFQVLLEQAFGGRGRCRGGTGGAVWRGGAAAALCAAHPIDKLLCGAIR